MADKVTWIVSFKTGATSHSQTVTADRVLVDAGLRFIDNIPGERDGTCVAAFAPGEWHYFKQLSERPPVKAIQSGAAR